MVKKIILLVLALALLAYILFAVLVMNPASGRGVCKAMDVEVLDTLERHFITRGDVAVILSNSGMTPVGKKMNEINTEAIEEKLRENKLIKKVECYKTSGGKIKIEIRQKIPILRIFSNSGSYYVDSEGGVMPVTGVNFAAYVPVATGYIEKEFATSGLYKFALFLHDDKFWNTQIEQIYIAPNQDLEFTPRVGNHQVILGKMEQVEENLEKLRLFYDKGLDEVGWNRYSVINLKYKNQVVCTKK